MLKAGKCNVLISIDAGSRATYKKVKGVDGWEKVSKACATYSKNSIKSDLILLKYIIFNENNDISEISGFFDFCEKVGVKHVGYSLEFRESHAREVSQQTLRAAAFFVSQAKQRGLIWQQAFIFEPYSSKIDELVATM